MTSKRALHCDYPGCTAESPIDPPPDPWPVDDGKRRRYVVVGRHDGWTTVPARDGRPAADYCPEHAAAAEEVRERDDRAT
jgi:hypothetical protein